MPYNYTDTHAKNATEGSNALTGTTSERGAIAIVMRSRVQAYYRIHRLADYWQNVYIMEPLDHLEKTLSLIPYTINCRIV